ncbi:hypothetical protein EK904_014675 [Melospiza melodia maxima]|nr:hypothetical protein EK904_014675 [Melospiza melodia maxima]
MQNFYAVNTTVRYVCRLAYENTTAQPPTSTCLDNLTWTEVPELCQKKSCGIPANPEHGQAILKDILKDHLLGGTARVVCDRGYRLKGASPSIRCLLEGDKAVWSPLPACQVRSDQHLCKGTAAVTSRDPQEHHWFLRKPGKSRRRREGKSIPGSPPEFSPLSPAVISCPPPPAIPHGQHSGSSSGQFVLGSVATYTCEPGLELVGQDTLRCTGDSGDSGDSGTWSGAPPACRGEPIPARSLPLPAARSCCWSLLPSPSGSTGALRALVPGLCTVPGSAEQHQEHNRTWVYVFPSRGAGGNQASSFRAALLSAVKYLESIVDFTLPFPSLLVPPVALGILAGIIVRRKESEKHSYNVNSQKQEVKGRDAAMHLEVTDEKKLPKPWNSYFW